METGMSRNLQQGNESSSIDLRKVKVAGEDIPPQYETLSPPTYESLFPEDEVMIPKLHCVNEKGNPGWELISKLNIKEQEDKPVKDIYGSLK